MKALIWFGCFLVHSIITTSLNSSGIMLGAIPAVLLATATFQTARKLCRKLDEYRTEAGKLNAKLEQ